jgi:RHS repeat-associated protein
MAQTGTWDSTSYRRWSIGVSGGYLKRVYYEGAQSNSQNLLALQADTWYEAILIMDGYERFRLVVWKYNDPTVWAESVLDFTTQDWQDKNWKFLMQVHTGTVDVDFYREYDAGAMGQRNSMTDASGSTSWRYDLRGRVTQERKVIGTDVFVTQWGYFEDGLLKWMKYPADNEGELDEQVNFTYRPQGLPNAVTGTSTYASSSTRYDAAGRLTQLVRGSGTLTTAYTYYGWNTQGGRLQRIVTGALQDLLYTYDNAGNVASIVDNPNSGQKQCFQYDALNRLTKGTTLDGTLGCPTHTGDGTYNETYTYSTSTGNLASKTGMGAYTYQDSAHKHAVTHLGGVQKYWYDANGNMITRIAGASTYNLTYDAENRLTGVSGGASATFVYDGDGNRVKGTVGGVTTLYIGNYFEWTSAGNTKYYYHGAQRLAMRRSGYTSGNGLFFLLGDHLGSTAVQTNSNGSLSASLKYLPWGSERDSSGTMRTTFRFTGQRAETDLGGTDGLYYYGARWYDSSLGRFISADSLIPNPGNVLDWDRYAAMRNNPLKYTDPTGHEICNADGWCGEYDPYYDIQLLSQMYGLVFSGKWSASDALTVLRAAIVIGSRMAQAVGGAGANVFRSVFNGLTLTLDSSLASTGYYGMASVDRVSLRPDKLTMRLVGHELGHVFSFRMYRGAGKLFPQNHPEILLMAGLWNNGFFMTGEKRNEPGSPYKRNDNVLGPTSGYRCDTVPCQYHLMREGTPQGRIDYMSDASLGPQEEWADMFLNWSLGGFTSSRRGKYYNNWMTTNMAEWVGLVGGQ